MCASVECRNLSWIGDGVFAYQPEGTSPQLNRVRNRDYIDFKWGRSFMRENAEPTENVGRVSTAESNAAVLRELVSHLRRNKTQLREEWARRIHDAKLL